jgi:tRNA(Ile)-lysidine synthetase-like protein
MLHRLLQIPFQVTVACSGGVDSMAVLHFLSQRKIKPQVAFFHHGNEFASQELKVVEKFCKEYSLSMIIGAIDGPKPKRESEEEFWRECRYAFLEKISEPVITAHHLDDVLETYLFSFFNGTAKFIPYQRNNIIRPFLITEKKDLEKWAIDHSVPYVVDPTNTELNRPRARIRNNIIPEILKINPGIKKRIKKMLVEKFNKNLEVENYVQKL